MASPKSIGRITGGLLLLHLVGGLMLPYILLQPATAAPGLLENAAENGGRIRAAVLLLFMGGAITIAVALTALPVLRGYGDPLAVFSILVCSLLGLVLSTIGYAFLIVTSALAMETFLGGMPPVLDGVAMGAVVFVGPLVTTAAGLTGRVGASAAPTRAAAHGRLQPS